MKKTIFILILLMILILTAVSFGQDYKDTLKSGNYYIFTIKKGLKYYARYNYSDSICYHLTADYDSLSLPKDEVTKIVTPTMEPKDNRGDKGLFLAVNIGIKMVENSRSGFIYGGKLLLYLRSLYPVAPFVEGSEEGNNKMTTGVLGTYLHFDTKHSIYDMASLPFVIAGLSINEINNPKDLADTLKFGFLLGFGFRFLKGFEINTTYNFLGDYSSFNVKLQLNFEWPFRPS